MGAVQCSAESTQPASQYRIPRLESLRSESWVGRNPWDRACNVQRKRGCGEEVKQTTKARGIIADGYVQQKRQNRPYGLSYDKGVISRGI
jgi:hypothetical protein